MFEKILYPTDFSDVAGKALDYVKRLKDSGAKEVIVLHVNGERGNDSVIRILGENHFNKLNKIKKEETERKLKGVEKFYCRIDASSHTALRTLPAGYRAKCNRSDCRWRPLAAAISEASNNQ